MRCKSFSLCFQAGSNPTLLCSEGTLFHLDTVRLPEVRNRLTVGQRELRIRERFGVGRVLKVCRIANFEISDINAGQLF